MNKTEQAKYDAALAKAKRTLKPGEVLAVLDEVITRVNAETQAKIERGEIVYVQ